MKVSPIQYVVINWRLWKLDMAYDGHGRNCGWCDYGSRTIQVSKRDKGRDKLNTFCHETIHAAKKKMKHKDVRMLASALEEVLWKAGYRCE